MVSLVNELLALSTDPGPEGGGEIVAWGPAENIVKALRSYTGKFLAPQLHRQISGTRAGQGGQVAEAKRERGGA
jgi:excinuclease UvrABC ATPase subunit